MPSPPLSNPYNPTGDAWESNHQVVSRVSEHDYRYIKTKFPFLRGLTDKIVATAYKKIVDELRRIDSITPLEPAWNLNHPTADVLTDILDRFQCVERSVARGPDSRGDLGAQPVERRPSGVHQESSSASQQRTESSSSDEGKGGVPENKEGKTRPRRGGTRVAKKSTAEDVK